jgi:hypothetical protein
MAWQARPPLHRSNLIPELNPVAALAAITSRKSIPVLKFARVPAPSLLPRDFTFYLGNPFFSIPSFLIQFFKLASDLPSLKSYGVAAHRRHTRTVTPELLIPYPGKGLYRLRR